jgi:hypothetical protein
MKLDQLIHAGVLCADLTTVDAHFTSIGIGDLNGIVYLKTALVALANVTDFETALKPTYRAKPEPSELFKPLQKNLVFAKYLRNKFVGHIHASLITKAIEWQPLLRKVSSDLNDPKAMLLVNIWLLETTINTYVADDGSHRVFSGETDLMYPPDWYRFLDFMENTIRGSILYLQLLNKLWAPELIAAQQTGSEIESALEAGKTNFRFLSQ